MIQKYRSKFVLINKRTDKQYPVNSIITNADFPQEIIDAWVKDRVLEVVSNEISGVDRVPEQQTSMETGGYHKRDRLSARGNRSVAGDDSSGSGGNQPERTGEGGE